MPGGGDWRARRRLAFAAAAMTVVMTIAWWPSRRSVGVNFVVTEQRLPLWKKVADFVARDRRLARASADLLGGHADVNVQPTPPGAPVIDDHIWDIIVRRYGESDQIADVFTTLLAYQEVPAYWTLIGVPPDQVTLSYVWIRDRWRVYDVSHGVVFRNHEGDLATPAELAADPQLIADAAAAAKLDVPRYMKNFQHFTPPAVPAVLRADLQMPGRRLWHEVRQLAGIETRSLDTQP
jgi:hypothetical protein